MIKGGGEKKQSNPLPNIGRYNHNEKGVWLCRERRRGGRGERLERTTQFA